MPTLSMCSLGFAGFLRYSELANIKLCDISFEETHMAINIVRSKTYVYKEGHKLCNATTHCVTCLVHKLEHYLKMLDVDINSQEYLFRSLTYCENTNTYRVRRCNRPLSYTRAR